MFFEPDRSDEGEWSPDSLVDSDRCSCAECRPRAQSDGDHVPDEQDGWGDPGDGGMSGADFYEMHPELEPPGPDALDLVLETDAMVAVFAAERLRRIYSLRRELLRGARPAARGDLLRDRRRVSTEILERGVRLELATALRVTEYMAGRMIGLAEALFARYPRALTSLGRAQTTEAHVTALVDALEVVEPEVRERVFGRALELAETQPLGTFRRALRALVEEERATTMAQRHEEALRQRRVYVEPANDGMAWLMLFAPEVEVRAIHGRVTAMAKAIAKAGAERGPVAADVANDAGIDVGNSTACVDADSTESDAGEHRTLDQVRADVMGDLLVDGVVPTHAPEVRGIRATVAVTVPALTLLGELGGELPVVEGIGPISVQRAQELCGGADGWMRVLTHPETGMVLSVGRTQYRPPPSLRRLVQWRADRCMAPGCGMPASRCQIDHSLAWEHGGETSLSNLAPICTGHHTVKHHGGWKLEQLDDSGGGIRWTSPAGRVYDVRPERRVPVFRPVDPPPF